MLSKKFTIPFLLLSVAIHAQTAPISSVSSANLQAMLTASAERQCSGLKSLRTVSAHSALLEVYQQSGFVSLWQAPARLAALKHELSQLADDGLIPADYSDALDASPPTEACDELRVTSEYLLALEHLEYGRLAPENFAPQWQQANPVADDANDLVDIALRGLQDMSAAFDAARPALPLYRELRLAYQQMNKQPAPQQPLSAGPTIKPGLDDPRLPQLVQRLQAAGYLEQASAYTNGAGRVVYGAEIEQAVRRFQADHGLQVDSAVGVQTLAALNVSPLQRLQQVRINLERLRWLNTQRSDPMLLVNIAGGDIRLYRNQAIVWQSRVMSGRPERPTPALISRINRITINPSWTVPPTIFKEDKVPQILRNPDFLVENDLHVLDFQGRAVDPSQVDWNNPTGIMLRQPPGPANPLGSIAFRFPSPFAIYLHDTPSKNLFEKSARNVSSGCVRVEDAQGLASQLLAEKSDEERKEIVLMQESGETHEITLRNGPQLIITYWTAEAGNTGRVRFFRDPYNLDHALMMAFRDLDEAYQTVAQVTPEQAAIVCGS